MAEKKERKTTSKWTTEKVEELIDDLENGYDLPQNNPFWDKDPAFRLGNIVFEYTKEELLEIKKCMNDVVYFANKYCYAMTDDGIQNITLRDYQEDVLRAMQNNRMTVFLAPRQIGKTITTSLYLAWYVLFNTEKNCLVLANKGETMEELIDKSKEILKHLPFFLKPGMVVNNVRSMRFDNGCRLFGQSTTKAPAIGFTIHFLFMDEFAHIHPNFLEPFYRAVYPTISSSKTAKIAITSTPNGMNKFYEIYTAALEKKNDYYPIKVDWWQVPGRDEEWKKKEIANLGSEEDFNQEYGCQFLSSSTLLLGVDALKLIKNRCTEYKWRELEPFEDKLLRYEDLKWHPKFKPDEVQDGDGKSQYVLSVDTAGGTGNDHSVITIWKLIPAPLDVIKSTKKYIDESDFFSLLQVGVFRDNNTSIEDFTTILETLMYEIFSPEQISVVVEVDYKGYLILEKMRQNYNFYDELLVHTKHTEKAKRLSPGVRQTTSNKMLNCLEFRRFINKGRIIANEKMTYEELNAFGLNNRGTYSSQIGHDDIAMTCIDLSSYFRSTSFNEGVEMIYDEIEDKYRIPIAHKISNQEDGDDEMDNDWLKKLMDQ